jgi:uncharacterized protein YndB with AHSA1/START domain
VTVLLATSMSLAAILVAQTQQPIDPGGARATANLEPLVTEAVVGAPVSEIWRVFTTPQGYTALGIAKADIDFRPGGLILTTYDASKPLDGEAAIQTEILAYEPARMIATRIHRPPKGFPFREAWKTVWTVVSMADLGDGRSAVRVAMMGWRPDAESQAMREFFRTGNDWVMKKLQSHYGAVAPPAGPAHAESPLAPVDVHVVVQADRSSVWRTFATGEGWRSFMGVPATIGSLPGEPFEVSFDPAAPRGERGSEGCKVLALVPREMLAFTWNAPPKFAFARTKRTWVVVTFDALAAGRTRVRLRELGFAELATRYPAHGAEIEQVRAYFAHAWGKVLAALAGHFTHDDRSGP